VSRESAVEKAKRYLGEARLVVRDLDENAGVVLADCRGNGSIDSCGRDERGWFCDCPALTTACAHLLALKSVTALEPREAK
jgi:hypothetical protein